MPARLRRMANPQRQDPKHHRHRTVAMACGALVVLMVAAAFAAVPLYRLFCESTGFAGTPQRAAHPSAASIEKTITVRFDANVTPGMPWRFEPVQPTLD